MPVRSSNVFTWFRRKYGEPTPAQAAAWPLIARGANVLLASPTGTGKTFAAFLSVPDALVAEDVRGTIDDRIHCVDVSTSKKIELRVYTPLRKNPYPEAGYTGERLIRELGALIKKHRNTLIFSNIRSGAEATTYWLRENFPELADKIECHHASLERDIRREVEDRLKRGELRAVVCSTSLELGIDIGSIDLVVMLSTPKGVRKALQRAGRAGHNIHVTSRGVLMATNVSDLVEACATVLLARKRHLDEVRIPRAPLDVLLGLLGKCGIKAPVERELRAGPYLLLHGEGCDATVAEKQLAAAEQRRGRVIIGHEHPAIRLSDGVATSAKCPCFVFSAHLLVLPAFSAWAAGTNVRSHEFMSSLGRHSRMEGAVAIAAGKLLPIKL